MFNVRKREDALIYLFFFNCEAVAQRFIVTFLHSRRVATRETKSRERIYNYIRIKIKIIVYITKICI